MSLVLAAGCQPRNDNRELEERQDQILAALERLDHRVAGIEKRLGANAQRGRRPAIDPKQIHAIPVTDRDPYLGAKNAKVTIVEASEYACPYCAGAAPIIEQVLDAYDDEVKVVLKQFVVHPKLATWPALATCAASEQGKLKAFRDELWKRAWPGAPRPHLDREQLSVESLKAIAADRGLDVDRFERDMNGPACKQLIERSRRELTAAGVTGTPTFFVNGKRYAGPRTVEGFKAVIDAEIAKADKALAGGVVLEDYYEHVTRN